MCQPSLKGKGFMFLALGQCNGEHGISHLDYHVLKGGSDHGSHKVMITNFNSSLHCSNALT